MILGAHVRDEMHRENRARCQSICSAEKQEKVAVVGGSKVQRRRPTRAPLDRA